MLLPQVRGTGTAISATPQPQPQVAGQMSDKRFGLIVTGSPSPAALNANLALLGNQRTWYSYDHTAAQPEDNRQRVHLVRTGTAYSSNLAALQSYVQTMPTGSYWLIGNEPNVDGQDNATPAQYASQYEAIKNAIRQTDPTARMVGPNILNWDQTCESCSGFPLGKDWVPQMLAAYQTLTGHPIDFDAWGVHTYGITWAHLPMTHYQTDIDQLEKLRAYLDGLPSQANKPIWITEFGVIWGYPGYTVQNGKIAPVGQFQQQAVLDYLGNYMDWLLANAEAKHIDRWYLYTSYGLPEPYASVYAGISLFDGVNTTSQLTDFGQLYLSKSLTAAVNAPSGLTLTAFSPAQIRLAWTNSAANQTGFQIDRKAGSAGIWSPLATAGPNITGYTDSSLAAGTEYSYRVQAFNSRVNSDFSNVVITINAPSNLSVSLNGATEADLSWTDNSSLETNYNIERRAGLGGSWQVLSSLGANQTTFQDTGLTAGTIYFYRVRASSSSPSAYSAYITNSGLVTPAPASQQVTSSSDDGMGDTSGTFSYALHQADVSGLVRAVTFDPAITQVNLDKLPDIPANITIGGSCNLSSGPAVTLNAPSASNHLSGWPLTAHPVTTGTSLFGLIINGTTLKFNSGGTKIACLKVRSVA